MSDLQKKVVDALPVLDPALDPDVTEASLPEGSALVVFDSPLRNAEKEWVLGIVATAAIRAKKWEPVPATKFGEVMGDLHQGDVAMAMFGQSTINAVWQLAEQGLLEIVSYEGKDYLVPKPEFAQMLTQSIRRRT